MIRFNILGVTLFILVIGFRPRIEGQLVPATPFSPRPLCNYQMALANQACAYLPFIQIPPPAPRTPFDPDPPPSDDVDTPEHEHDHEHEHGHRHEHDEDRDPGQDQNQEDPDRGHGHGRGHDHDHDREHDHGHGHGHGHKRHHHHHRHKDTPVEEQCCKWLAQVDDQCVCELLVHLPPFLARPVHNYAVIIGGACNFTFSCGSGLWK